MPKFNFWKNLQFLDIILIFLNEIAVCLNEIPHKNGLLLNPVHPLTPLSTFEIEQTSILIKAKMGDITNSLVFVSISLLEPTKAEMQENQRLRLSEQRTGLALLSRKSFSVVFDRMTGKAFEVTVNLSTDQVDVQMLPAGVQPGFLVEDEQIGNNIAQKNPEVRRRLKALGFNTLENILFVAWAPSAFQPSDDGKRILHYYIYFKKFMGDNKYAHPLNMVLVIDLIENKLLHIVEPPLYANGSTTPLNVASLPMKTANIDPLILVAENPNFYRKDSRPIRTRTKNGPNFTLKNFKVKWQKFKFRFGFNAREGLVLYDISYQDGANRRPLIYRAALSEMFVSYGDPHYPYQLKSVFDEGEFLIGSLATSLRPNAQCFKNGLLVDVVLNSADGSPTVIPNAICIHEEDGGLLHKHTTVDGRTVVARAQILVFHFSITADNYDYGFYWKFHQDATISFEVLLSGILMTNLYLDKSSPYGTVVSPGVIAHNHQHIFNVRIDPMFDGEQNTVSTVDVELAPDSENLFRHGFTTRETPLRTSLGATTTTNLETDRVWKISNPKSKNPITKEPVAWKLIPMNQQLILDRPGSLFWKRAEFASNAVWVTRYRDYELYAAGDYPAMSHGGDGLPKYVKRNETIVGKDIVVWHSFGTTHIPRLEDYPQMASEKVGFILKPCNFFTKAPGLDVPPIS